MLIIKNVNLTHIYLNKLNKTKKKLYGGKRNFLFKRIIYRYLKYLFILKNNLIIFKNNNFYLSFISFKNRRSFYKNLIKYKKLINQVNYLKFYSLNSLFLVNHFIFLGNFSSNLLKEYFYSKIYEFCKYKYNFEPILLTKLVQNYIYTYKIHKFLNKNILLRVHNNIIDLFNYVEFLKSLTLIPYNILPFGLVSMSKNTLLYLTNCYNKFFCYKYNKTNYNFLNFFYIEKIKKIIISFIIFITKKLIITIGQI